MKRFQAGDKTSFALLVRRYQGPLYNFALRHVRVDTAAEDVVQEAFIRVVQNGAEFKFESRVSTWLFSIARNLSIDHLRKAALRKHPSLDQPTSDSEESRTLGETIADSKETDRSAEGERLKGRLEAAVRQLPEEQREVFLLRETGDMPFKDIAELTGVSENTVKSRMRYALLRLKELLADYEADAKALH